MSTTTVSYSRFRPNHYFTPTQTPTQMILSRFPAFSSQEIGSILVSFRIIFEAYNLGQIRLWLTEVENQNNPGIQPNYD